jgi:hypothetical protein
MGEHYNADAVRLVKPYIDKAIADAVGAFISTGGTLPTAAKNKGELFVKTGEDAGLYVSTGTTTPGWKAVSHAE